MRKRYFIFITLIFLCNNTIQPSIKEMRKVDVNYACKAISLAQEHGYDSPIVQNRLYDYKWLHALSGKIPPVLGLVQAWHSSNKVITHHLVCVIPQFLGKTRVLNSISAYFEFEQIYSGKYPIDYKYFTDITHPSIHLQKTYLKLTPSHSPPSGYTLKSTRNRSQSSPLP